MTMTAVPEGVTGPVGNPAVIQALEQALALARAGRIHGVAVVWATGPGGTQATAAGGFLAELFMGCSILQDAIMKQAMGGTGGGRILRPM